MHISWQRSSGANFSTASCRLWAFKHLLLIGDFSPTLTVLRWTGSSRCLRRASRARSYTYRWCRSVLYDDYVIYWRANIASMLYDVAVLRVELFMALITDQRCYAAADRFIRSIMRSVHYLQRYGVSVRYHIDVLSTDLHTRRVMDLDISRQNGHE